MLWYGMKKPKSSEREDDVRARELPLGKEIAVDRADQRRQDGGRDHHDQAVDHVGAAAAARRPQSRFGW